MLKIARGEHENAAEIAAFCSVAWKYRELAAFSTGSQYRLVPGDYFHACQVGILVLICTDKFYGNLPRSSASQY